MFFTNLSMLLWDVYIDVGDLISSWSNFRYFSCCLQFYVRYKNSQNWLLKKCFQNFFWKIVSFSSFQSQTVCLFVLTHTPGEFVPIIFFLKMITINKNAIKTTQLYQVPRIFSPVSSRPLFFWIWCEKKWPIQFYFPAPAGLQIRDIFEIPNRGIFQLTTAKHKLSI